MRQETITANNDSTRNIILTRYDDDIVIITYNWTQLNTTLFFTIPDWAKPQAENNSFSGGVVLAVPAPGTTITYQLSARIDNYFDLTFTPLTLQDYQGTFHYQAQAQEGGIILDGIRLTCIKEISERIFAVMYESTRNHQGEIIISQTEDTTQKKEFTITTIPIAESRYQLSETIYSNTIQEIESLLYEKIGEYRLFHNNGIDYTAVLSNEITVTQADIFLPGNIHKIANIYKFTLIEV